MTALLFQAYFIGLYLSFKSTNKFYTNRRKSRRVPCQVIQRLAKEESHLVDHFCLVVQLLHQFGRVLVLQGYKCLTMVLQGYKCLSRHGETFIALVHATAELPDGSDLLDEIPPWQVT